MRLHYCHLKNDMLDIAFSEGKTHVQMQMPYWKLQNWLDGYPLFHKWTLTEQVEQYVKHCWNLAEILS